MWGRQACEVEEEYVGHFQEFPHPICGFHVWYGTALFPEGGCSGSNEDWRYFTRRGNQLVSSKHKVLKFPWELKIMYMAG